MSRSYVRHNSLNLPGTKIVQLLFTDALADAPEMQYANEKRMVRPKASNIRLACSDHRPRHSLRRYRASRSKRIRSTEKRVRKTTAELDFFALQLLVYRYSMQVSRRSLCLCRKPNNRHEVGTMWYGRNASGSRLRLEGLEKADMAIETQGEGLSINIP